MRQLPVLDQIEQDFANPGVQGQVRAARNGDPVHEFGPPLLRLILRRAGRLKSRHEYYYYIMTFDRQEDSGLTAASERAASLVIGIDAGGTKLAVGLVDADEGQILERRETPTERHRGGQAVLEDCLELLSEVSGGRQIAAIGAGVPELVSLEGKIQTAENWDWRDDQFRLAFAEIAPLHVESDVRAAALAEARFGAGRALSSFLYLTIGTGVSHTFVVNGLPWRGARGNAIVTGAPPVELAASGAALAKQARRSSGKEVLASPADEPLVEVAAQVLGTELAALVNALDPEAVIVGGGLGLAPGFMERVVGRMRPQIYAASTRDLAVRPSGLGVDAGVIGAALSAADEFGVACQEAACRRRPLVESVRPFGNRSFDSLADRHQAGIIAGVAYELQTCGYLTGDWDGQRRMTGQVCKHCPFELALRRGRLAGARPPRRWRRRRRHEQRVQPIESSVDKLSCSSLERPRFEVGLHRER